MNAGRTIGAAMAAVLDTQNPRKGKAMVALLCAVTMLSVTTIVLRSSGQSPTELKSDILPSQVLEDDGSTSDRTEALAASRLPGPDYARSHWYMHGQSKDFHGDLQQEKMKREAHDYRREQQLRATQLEQRREEARREQQQRVLARNQARQQALASVSDSSKASAGASQDSFAYRHPFAEDSKGMKNLVVAEFKEDEERMKETNDAIFGGLKDNHEWRHGGMTLNSVYENPPTLHEDLQRYKEAKLRQSRGRSRFSSLSELRRADRRAAAAPAPAPAPAPAVACTIEMLENGLCSSARKHPESKATVRAAMSKIEAASKLLLAQHKHRHVELKAAAAAPKTKQAAPARTAELAVAPDQAPTAGSVISGWASDVGSLF